MEPVDETGSPPLGGIPTQKASWDLAGDMPGSWPWSRSPSPPRVVVPLPRLSVDDWDTVIEPSVPKPELIEDSKALPMEEWGNSRPVSKEKAYMSVKSRGFCYLNFFATKEHEELRKVLGRDTPLAKLFAYGEGRTMSKYSFAITWRPRKEGGYLMHVNHQCFDDWRYLVRGRYFREDLEVILADCFPDVSLEDIYIGGEPRRRQKPAAQAQNQTQTRSGFVLNPEATVFVPTRRVSAKTRPVWIKGEMFVPRTISDAIACTQWRNINERGEELVTRSGHFIWNDVDTQARKLIARAETHRWFVENKPRKPQRVKRTPQVTRDLTWHHGRCVEVAFSGVVAVVPMHERKAHQAHGKVIPSLNPMPVAIPRTLKAASSLTAREKTSVKAGKPPSYIKSSIDDAIRETQIRNASRQHINADFVIAEAFYQVTKFEVERAERKKFKRATAWVYNDNLHPDTSISQCVRLSALRDHLDGERRMFGAVRSLIANTAFIVKENHKRMGSSLRKLIPRKF